MRHDGLRIVLVAVLTTLTASRMVMFAKAEPKDTKDQTATSSTEGMGRAADEPKDSEKPESTALQGTPVLGVIIGKPQESEAAEVVHVQPGSPAEKAGIEPGDRIVKLGDDEIASPEGLRAAVLERAVGEQVTISVIRDGESKSMKARLGGTDHFHGWARRGPVMEPSDHTTWLGVRTARAQSAEERGVIIQRVFPGSPADTAGLESGDVILRVGKTRVEAASDLKAAVTARDPNETVKLVIQRNGSRKTFQVTLGTFADWHRALGRLNEREIRDVLRQLVTGPLDVIEDVLPRRAQPEGRRGEEVRLPKEAVAKLVPTQGHEVTGTILLKQREDGLHLSGKVRGLKPGLHGFHIHEFGDLRGPRAQRAGGHFNPEGTTHGGPDDEEHHAGDLGNIEANEDGIATVDIKAPWLTLHFVIGRSIVVHEGKDDLKSQPSGDAGSRVAIGVIGIAQPSKTKQEK